jgi:hypothetical protein
MIKLEIKTGYKIGNEIAYSTGFPLKERPLSKKKWISKESLIKWINTNYPTNRRLLQLKRELEGDKG